MLRTNLSTRPFYNERAVHLIIGLIALLVLALTVGNVVELIRLSRQNTGLAGSIRDDRTTATELGRKARETRQNINQDELKIVAAAAREANALIDGRTFSWTALFNQLESTLPPEVMLASVRPTIDDGQTLITMIVVARRTADIDEFMEKLEASGAFESVLPRQQAPPDETGLTQVTIEARYVPEVVPATPAEAPATPAPPSEPAKPVRPAKTATVAGGTR